MSNNLTNNLTFSDADLSEYDAHVLAHILDEELYSLTRANDLGAETLEDLEDLAEMADTVGILVKIYGWSDTKKSNAWRWSDRIGIDCGRRIGIGRRPVRY